MRIASIRRLLNLSIVFLLINACATPIGRITESFWFCGEATAETRQADCTILEGSTLQYPYKYSGPVSPINYSEAAPNGWGQITNLNNNKKIRAKLNYGKITNLIYTLQDGSKFNGRVDSTTLKWLEGTLENSTSKFIGSFDANQNPKEGTKTYKIPNKELNTFGEFKGKFKSNGKASSSPIKGTYTFLNQNLCPSKIKFTGSFKGETNSGSGLIMDCSRKFTIQHPIAKILFTPSDLNNSASIAVDFLKNEDGIDFDSYNPVITDCNTQIASIASNENVLRISKKDNSVSNSKFTWNSPLSCSSYPTYTSGNTFLESTINRIAVIDGGKNQNKLEEFNFKIQNNLPSAFEGQLLIIKLINKNASRSIGSREEVESKYVSGQNQIYNTKYDTARARLSKAQTDLARAELREEERQRNTKCNEGDYLCALAYIVADYAADARNEYNSALKALENTPLYIFEDVYTEYSVEKLKINAEKSADLKVVFIDFDRNYFYEKSYPLSERKNFSIINSPIAETDINQTKLLSGTSSEKTADIWMTKDIKIENDVIQIFKDLIAFSPKQKINKSRMENFIKKLFESNNIQMNQLQVERSRKKDKKEYELEDSILVVSTLEGSGTGFYISKYHILTNEHVVEDSGFVELRNFAGNTFTGNVIASDISTDLALIRVPVSGLPLELESSCRVKRREEVFTVGHPKGFEYSTSRGIVSSIRVMNNPFYLATDKKKYIQIDASISSGNSGGPLFNSSDKVIGVNTMSREDGQNLNFSVHCSEVKSFLAKNKIQ
ncbi:serine protease [Pseudomonadota bacterium]|nr:serine protease [Pseudomonadota bacterium]